MFFDFLEEMFLVTFSSEKYSEMFDIFGCSFVSGVPEYVILLL